VRSPPGAVFYSSPFRPEIFLPVNFIQSTVLGNFIQKLQTCMNI
jgi:hypothetical protein